MCEGAHFVFCIKVYKDNHRCVFLDPFYSLLEVLIRSCRPTSRRIQPALPAYRNEELSSCFGTKAIM